MDQKTRSQKFLRHRKFLVVLPVLVLPFITMIFWSLGGGKSSDVTAESLSVHKGLNTQLPDAVLKDDPSLTKMSFYDRAASDSFKRSELIKSDQFFQLGSSPDEQTYIHTDTLPGGKADAATLSTMTGSNGRNFTTGITGTRDVNEEKVYRKLEELNKAMNQASAAGSDKVVPTDSYVKPATGTVSSTDIEKLDKMMNVMKSGSEGDDQQMNQLNGMLDKIMDIQHPERVAESIRQTSLEHQSRVFPVSATTGRNNISLLGKSNVSSHSRLYGSDTFSHPMQNGFYSLDSSETALRQQNAISAVVHEMQSLVSGATVKMRLAGDVYINGVLIPKDNFVYGTAELSDERLKIAIESIRYQNSIFPVRLSVYDMDGMEGIFIPGSISRDVAKSSADQALQGVGITGLSSSIPVQAAGAGIQAAKSLLSKKAKLIKVSVKAGYQVLLKDAGQ